MATESCSTKYLWSAAEVAEAMYGNQPIFMHSFLAFRQRQSRPFHLTSASLSLGNRLNNTFRNSSRFDHTFILNLNIFKYGPRRKKTCLRGFANNTGADQPAHPRSLISAFVIRFL